MDALTDILKNIRLSASTYFCTDFNAPWGMDIGESNQAMFHVVVEGDCWLKIEGAQSPMHLNSGDIVAFPTGGAHWISDAQDSLKLPGTLVVKKVLKGENPFQTESDKQDKVITLLCGAFSYDSSVDHPFLKDLPCFIHIETSESPDLDWLRSLVTVLSIESRNPSPGSTVIVDRLTEVLFIQLLRAYMKTAPSNTGFMAALTNKQIGSALNRIHADSEGYWTVERLGDAVALSRSAFTEKFTKLVGIPPKAYLVNWRMQKAKTRLVNRDVPMIVIAKTAGYSSEAAFSKAFKQFFGITPGRARRGLG